MRKSPSILFVGATMAPLIKVGGLADVMESLPQALHAQGSNVSVLIPYYDIIHRVPGRKKKRETHFTVHFNKKSHRVTVYTYSSPGKPDLHLLRDRHFFKGKKVYPLGYIGKSKIKKENQRFSFFSLAAAHYIRTISKKPDVVHVHDWHPALLPYLLTKLLPRAPKTVLTIHNIAFQGVFPKQHTEKLLQMELPTDGETINFLRHGILYADTITTVSPTYAQEILTPKFGFGLQQDLRKRKRDLVGIVNGISLERFNPQTDSALAIPYSSKSATEGKQANKERLMKNLKLLSNQCPLFGMVSRLFEQKGLSILEPLLPFIAERGGSVVILGNGDPQYERSLRAIAKKYKKHISVIIGFDARLANLIYAGSDFFLMPSQFEPCGLGQMIAMRYGTLPIVRVTGGLKDTVTGTGASANGIVFSGYSVNALKQALKEAFSLYTDETAMEKRIQNAFAKDFSWKRSAGEYQKLYTSRKRK